MKAYKRVTLEMIEYLWFLYVCVWVRAHKLFFLYSRVSEFSTSFHMSLFCVSIIVASF